MSYQTQVALRRAEAHGIQVNLYQLSRQWICSVDGHLIHINYLARVVDEAISNKARKAATCA